MGVGRISVPNATEYVAIVNPETGEKIGEWYPHTQTPAEVPAGTYTLKWKFFEIDGIEVDAGKETAVDAKTLVGWISLPNATEYVAIVNPETGEKIGEWYPHTQTPAEVPAGTYTLKWPRFEAGTIEVKAGEEVVVE
jgi:hypothetical protein